MHNAGDSNKAKIQQFCTVRGEDHFFVRLFYKHCTELVFLAGSSYHFLL